MCTVTRRTRTQTRTRTRTQTRTRTRTRASHYFSSPHRVALPRWSHVVQGAFSGFFPSAASVAARLLPPLSAGPPPSPPGSAANIWGSGLLENTRKPEQQKGRVDRGARSVQQRLWLGSVERLRQVGTWRIFTVYFNVRVSWKTRRSCVRLFWFWL